VFEPEKLSLPATRGTGPKAAVAGFAWMSGRVSRKAIASERRGTKTFHG
jgi:hypothetical protein